MKKLAVILIVVLLLLFTLNAVKTVALEPEEITVNAMINHFNTQFAKLTDDEMNKVVLLLPQKDFVDAGLFCNQFAAFCRVVVAVDKVITER